jgi:hypothetical protein
MKITIDIDCTPAEARQFMGLPDLQPMQERLIKEMEQRLRVAADKMTPDAIIQQWFSAWPAGIEEMRRAWEMMMKTGSANKTGSADKT